MTKTSSTNPRLTALTRLALALPEAKRELLLGSYLLTAPKRLAALVQPYA